MENITKPGIEEIEPLNTSDEDLMHTHSVDKKSLPVKSYGESIPDIHNGEVIMFVVDSQYPSVYLIDFQITDDHGCYEYI